MTKICKRILLVCAFVGASLGAAGADPFNMPADGGMDPNLTPAARARVNARDAAVNKGLGKLEGVPRANGRVFGQVDTDANGNFLIPGITSDSKGTFVSGAPRGADTGPLKRLGVHTGGTGGRIGLNDVPKVHTVHTGGAGRVSVNSVPTPKVAPSVPHLHTPR